MRGHFDLDPGQRILQSDELRMTTQLHHLYKCSK